MSTRSDTRSSGNGVPGRAGDGLHEEFLLNAPNQLAELVPEMAHLASTVRVIDIREASNGRVLRVLMNGEKDRAVGYLATVEG